MLYVAITSQQHLEPSLCRQPKQYAVPDAGPPDLRDGRDLVPHQVATQRAWHILIEQEPHSDGNVTSKISSAAIT